MEVLSALERLRAARWTAEDGVPASAEPLPGLSALQLAGIEADLGASLPDDFRVLASVCGGFEGLSIDVDLSGESMDLGLEELLPHGHAFAADGFGNFWVADVRRDREEETRVLFACHDAPVLYLQCVGMAAFLDGLPRPEPFAEVRGDRLYHVWRDHPGTVPAALARESADPELRAFAARLDDRFLLVDLRHVPSGMGFAWGRFGPRTESVRDGDRRIFAYARPERKSGPLARLFGR